MLSLMKKSNKKIRYMLSLMKKSNKKIRYMLSLIKKSNKKNSIYAKSNKKISDMGTKISDMVPENQQPIYQPTEP